MCLGSTPHSVDDATRPALASRSDTLHVLTGRVRRAAAWPAVDRDSDPAAMSARRSRPTVGADYRAPEPIPARWISGCPCARIHPLPATHSSPSRQTPSIRRAARRARHRIPRSRRRSQSSSPLRDDVELLAAARRSGAVIFGTCGRGAPRPPCSRRERVARLSPLSVARPLARAPWAHRSVPGLRRRRRLVAAGRSSPPSNHRQRRSRRRSACDEVPAATLVETSAGRFGESSLRRASSRRSRMRHVAASCRRARADEVSPRAQSLWPRAVDV